MERSPQRSRIGRRLAVPAGTLGAVLVLLLGNAALVKRQQSAGADGGIPVDGHSIHVRGDGSPDAPALALIHGLAGSTRWWDEMVPTLARRHHVIRIDLLGHGRSAKPTDADYSMEAQGRRVGRVLDHLDVRGAVVVGHSTGGWVATSLVEQRPELVDRLGLIGTGPSMAALQPQSVLNRALPAPLIGPLLWRARTDGLLRKGMASAFSTPGYEIPRQLVDDVGAMTYHSFTATNQATDDYLTERSVPKRLRHLRVPLLVIFGAEDARWNPADAADYRAVPRSRVEVIADVGHSPMLEAPDRTAALLQQLSPARRD